MLRYNYWIIRLYGEIFMCDVITIGSATMDVFVESDDANIVSVYTKNKKSEFMSYPYGAKVEITDFASKVGGGGANPFLLGGTDGISRRGDVAAEFDLNKSKCIALAGDKVDFSGGGAAAGDVIVCQNLPPVEAKIPTCRQLG